MERQVEKVSVETLKRLLATPLEGIVTLLEYRPRMPPLTLLQQPALLGFYYYPTASRLAD